MVGYLTKICARVDESSIHFSTNVLTAVLLTINTRSPFSVSMPAGTEVGLPREDKRLPHSQRRVSDSDHVLIDEYSNGNVR